MKKKLNFIASNLSGKGGTETVLIKVLNQLVTERSIQLTLIDDPKDKNWLSKLDKNITVKICKRKNPITKLLFVVREFIFNKNCNHISLSPKVLKVGSKLRKIMNLNYKLISWIHFSLKDQDMFDPRDLLYADFHLAISSVIEKQLISMGIKKENIKLILNPVEICETLPKNQDGRADFFYAGRVMYSGQKNLKELFLGISKVTNLDLHLNIYGTGNDLDKCKKYSEQLGIADKITWHGWTENLWEEIKKRPTALIMTSKYEGLPMIMLESIARGIPVVSTKFAGYEDILRDGENSYTYSQGDINGLIRAMTDVANTSLSPECIKKSIEKYYPEKYFKKLKESLEYFENNNR